MQTILWAKRIAASAGAILALLAALLLFCFYTPPGHDLVAAAVEPLTGGKVSIKGLSGTLPNHLTVERVEVRDSKGAWLVIEGAGLDWNLWPALGNHIEISRLAVDRIAVMRLPEPSKSSSTSSMSLDAGGIAIGRIELGKQVLGRAAVLSAKGSLHYVSRHDVAAELTIRRRDGDGRYDIHAAIADDIAHGSITIAETGPGLAGGVLGLPDLGPVMLEARANAQGSANALRFKLTADALDMFGGGTIDLKAEQADLDFSAVAPAMAPSPQLSWQSVTAKGHIHGAFATPDINADVKITGLNAGGAKIAGVTAQVQGSGGKVHLASSVDGLSLPGEKTGVFSEAAVLITADTDLASPKRAIRFTIRHPLLLVVGDATTAAPLALQLTAKLPSLGGLASLTGAKLDGNASFSLVLRHSKTATDAKLAGNIAAQGASHIAKLLGAAKFEGTAALNSAGDIALQAKVTGAAIKAAISGSQKNDHQSFTGEVMLSDLSRLSETLVGTLSMRGSLTGRKGEAKLNVQGEALAATKGMARQPVSMAIEAAGLPKFKAANLRVSGHFDGAPVVLKADIAQALPGTLKVVLTQASWRSAQAHGLITIAGNVPNGNVQASVARLGDLAALLGTQIGGSIAAHTEFSGSQAAIDVSGQNIAFGENRIGHANLKGTIADPMGKPVLALTLNLPEFATASVSGSASARITGPLAALQTNFTTALSTADGKSFTIAADTLTNLAAKHVAISRLEGIWRDQKITLAEPASLDYASGLKFAANFVDGKAAQIRMAGTVGQIMNIHASGTADLAVIGAGLAASGQQLRGRVAGDVTVTGTAAKPQVEGNVTVSGGEIRDYTRGVNLTNIEAMAEAQGPAIRLTKFTAKAGAGLVTGSGTIDLAAPGMPVDIAFKAANARPMASDLLTAKLDSDLKLEGRLSEALRLSGRVDVREANINIPEKFPAQVVSLKVRHSRATPTAPPPSPPGLRIALDLTIASRGRIFVRGRGLEAEFEGDLKISGTSLAPEVTGALSLRRGVMALGSTTLTFQTGKIAFNGQSLRQRLDPSLDLLAQTEANSVTATLKVTGTASQPKIELSSSPVLPQDEILAQLLFQKSMKSLSAMELAGVAQAAATMSGGGGFDPVGAVRRNLGLDRLAVGTDQGSASGVGSTSVEAGKYVLRNVYIGAKQDLSGGTKALVQVDITQHLKAQAQVNAGARTANTTSTPLHDNGDSIGLSYQFEY